MRSSGSSAKRFRGSSWKTLITGTLLFSRKASQASPRVVAVSPVYGCAAVISSAPRASGVDEVANDLCRDDLLNACLKIAREKRVRVRKGPPLPSPLLQRRRGRGFLSDTPLTTRRSFPNPRKSHESGDYFARRG